MPLTLDLASPCQLHRSPALLLALQACALSHAIHTAHMNLTLFDFIACFYLLLNAQTYKPSFYVLVPVEVGPDHFLARVCNLPAAEPQLARNPTQWAHGTVQGAPRSSVVSGGQQQQMPQVGQGLPPKPRYTATIAQF